MSSKSKAMKIHRKQRRCQALISKEVGMESSNSVTKVIAICNAGLSTGLQEESLLEEITRHGNVNKLLMIPNKSYCFIQCIDVENSQKIYTGIHGATILGQNDSVLYLSYFPSLPEYQNTQNKLPAGLIILENFVNEEEEANILTVLEDTTTEENLLKHRLVKHYGFEFLYGSNQVDPNAPLKRKIPEECDFLWNRLSDSTKNLEWYIPDQLTVNQYKPGQGIPPHVDTHSAFLDPILSLSLEDDTVMEFRKNEQHISVPLPRRSLLIMSGESRYIWTHGITPRTMDVIPSKSGNLTVRHRKQRTSLTFRKLRRSKCNCIYDNFCDTKKQEQEQNKNFLKEKAAILEVTNVHNVYNEIANHFSETRHSPWPKVSEFLKSFETGSIIIDIGCGNGKYLGINCNITTIGCDRSDGLLKVCKNNNFNVFQCDCLNVPLRDGSVNGCISIAVIHHLATEERRLQAISEMYRILQSKGKALIYVWAKNQEVDAKKSSYLRQNKAINKHKKTEEEQRFLTESIKKCTVAEVDLPIHTNRTRFQEQDVLVPWKLKNQPENTSSNEKTFLRYYHVFEENELENLCKKIEDIKIVESYYDQGNWCVIFEKI